MNKKEIKVGPGERCVNCTGEKLTEAELARNCSGPFEYSLRSTYVASEGVYGAEIQTMALCGKTVREVVTVSETSAQNILPPSAHWGIK